MRIDIVVGVIEMGNIAPRAVVEPTSLALGANMLTITPPRLPDIILLPMLIYLCSFLPERSVQLLI